MLGLRYLFEHTIVEYQKQTESLNVKEFEDLNHKYKLQFYHGRIEHQKKYCPRKVVASIRGFNNSTSWWTEVRGNKTLKYGEIKQVLEFLVAE